MSKEANITTQKKMGEIINSHEFQRLPEVFAADVKDHDPADDQGPGPVAHLDEPPILSAPTSSGVI